MILFFAFSAVVGLLFKLVLSPQSPKGTREEERGIETGANAYAHGEGKADDRIKVSDLGNDADRNNRNKGGERGKDVAGEGAVNAHINDFRNRLGGAEFLLVGTNSVVDNDGAVNGVTENGQHNGDKVIVKGNSENDIDKIGKRMS